MKTGHGGLNINYNVTTWKLTAKLFLALSKMFSVVRLFFCGPGRVSPYNQPSFPVNHIDGPVWKVKQNRLQEK